MIGHDQPGGEIVAAVEHQVDAVEQAGDIFGAEPRRPALADVGIEPGQRLAGDLGLGPADVGGPEQGLALEIVEGDDVVVDHPQRADSGGGEIVDGRRADAAGADHRDAGVEQLALALAANLLEHDVAGVAVELGVGGGSPSRRAEAAGAARGFVEILDLGEAGALDRRRHQLGDALAARRSRTARRRDWRGSP